MKTRLIVLLCAALASLQSVTANTNPDEEQFYQLFPDLRAHKEVVETAYEQLKQSGFQAKTLAEADRAIAIRAYVLLNQSSGAKMPYRQVLEEYNRVRSDFPELTDLHLSLPEFASYMNEKTGSRAFDEGLNDSWPRHDGAFLNRWGIVMVLAGLGVIFLVIVWGRQDEPRGESVWRRAMRPAGTAAKWGSIVGMLTVFRSHQHLSSVEWIGISLLFSLALGLVFALPVYLIVAVSYAMRTSRKLADSSIDISFNCPHCGQHLCVEESGAGMAVKCPTCNEQIEIPRRTASERTLASSGSV